MGWVVIAAVVLAIPLGMVAGVALMVWVAFTDDTYVERKRIRQEAEEWTPE